MNDEMRRLDDERFRQMESHLIGIAEATNKIMNNHLEHIAEDLKGLHAKTDDQTRVLTEQSKTIAEIDKKVTINITDLEWLKKFFWILATGIVGLFISQIVK